MLYCNAQAYVDQNLMCAIDGEGTTISSAALVGHDGSVWAQSSAFPAITAAESATIMNILSTGTSETGSFTIGGVKYFVSEWRCMKHGQLDTCKHP